MLTSTIDFTKFKTTSNVCLCKSLLISALALFVFWILLSSNSSFCELSTLVNLSSSYETDFPTNISHLMFSIAGSINKLKQRKLYLQTWWKPNITRGYLYLDKELPKEFLPWSPSLPLFRVSDDVTRLKVYKKHRKPMIIRIVRMVLETYREANDDVRWYIMGDDDTIFFTWNLVEVLGKYDHSKHYYIGANSESSSSNFDHSFEMAYGGGGIAISKSLVEALDGTLDGCIERYWNLYASDHVLHSCLADLGVSLTQEKGFHQIDLRNDISGLLSAHPQTPVLSLHHLDSVKPIFPSLNRYKSVNHLMEPANIDQNRLLQQTICYHKQNNWTYSVSWGYITHIYENIFPRSFLRRPLETFWPWKRSHRPFYTFNVRYWTKDPCQAPHSFYFKSIENSTSRDQIITTYIRASARGLRACSSSGNHSADFINKIHVFSPSKGLAKDGNRHECCDIIRQTEKNATEIKLRDCARDEVIA